MMSNLFESEQHIKPASPYESQGSIADADGNVIEDIWFEIPRLTHKAPFYTADELTNAAAKESQEILGA